MNTNTAIKYERKPINRDVARPSQVDFNMTKPAADIQTDSIEVSAPENTISLSDFVLEEVSFKYACDVNSLLEKYTNNGPWNSEQAGLIKIGDHGSLYTRYDSVDENGQKIEGTGKEYVENIIDGISISYSGREASVNAVLTILKLAADKGVKLDYQHKGTSESSPTVSTEDVASGVDCNAFVSWALNFGTKEQFNWRHVGGIAECSTKIEHSLSQPGDILYRRRNESFFINSKGKKVSRGDHIAIIIENNPKTEEIIYAEASGDNIGIILNKATYTQLTVLGMKAGDMSNLY